MKKTVWILVILLLGVKAYADDIEIPEDELARETTLPVFSKRRIVLNRNVITEKHLEIAGGPGWELNEPYYNNLLYGIQGTYNFTETSAVNLQSVFWAPGLSSYGTQLRQVTKEHAYFDPGEAPHPVWSVIANYEYVAYYGKISVTKQGVMNLNTFGLLGLGYMNLAPVNTVVLNIGVGQNFFFTNNIGLRWDLHWLIFQGPDATSQPLGPNSTPPASSFSNRMYYNAQIGLGLVFIL